ncbi:calcium uptake protein 3, mitochondrial isoform X2 [Condylostylus longicornis]|uniref:calcium uptake protein 3, mitochondrial isoform X2 n=1 Tax=Condylostylus longicornis TaxID=2530218 RepID=UPI00244E5A47|nr:calcium uptake protein 3, mitochondrial isoform X2 [Condylostylus longicornis]
MAFNRLFLGVRPLFNNVNIKRNFSNGWNYKNYRSNKIKIFYAVGGTCILAGYCTGILKSKFNVVHALNLRKDKDEEKVIKLTPRERRFIKFASVEFDGQLYMTPQDFLDSVVEQEPRPRLKRRSLTVNDVNKIKDYTPQLHQGSQNLFRSLRDKGIISYTEYLFLLSILTKPHSGFRIAFNMFDTDGNQRVDKTEFLVIRRILGGSMKYHDIDEATRKVMEKIFSGAWKDRHGETEESGENGERKEIVEDNEGLQRKHVVNTTLQVHFFGKKGSKDLYYEGFHKFMDNLQTEVLELEFSEFAKGKQSITEVDFAKILLRYTYLDTDEYDMYLDRLLDRVKDEKGITFNEFRDFCRFLNNLEDFAIAMRMYTLADRSISKDEFSRAVKICTGYTLTPHLIETVFAIFDEDGDGLLSYKEFIAIMKDRLHRGFKSVTKSEGWPAFKTCLRNEMRQGGKV